MRRNNLLASLLLLLPSDALCANITTPSTLNITALTGRNGLSLLECWALQPGFVTSTEAGTSGSMNLNLGMLGSANATYSVIPAGFDGGAHRAPVVQSVMLIVFHYPPHSCFVPCNGFQRMSFTYPTHKASDTSLSIAATVLTHQQVCVFPVWPSPHHASQQHRRGLCRGRQIRSHPCGRHGECEYWWSHHSLSEW